jgi:hypothetical protein
MKKGCYLQPIIQPEAGTVRTLLSRFLLEDSQGGSLEILDKIISPTGHIGRQE